MSAANSAWSWLQRNTVRAEHAPAATRLATVLWRHNPGCRLVLCRRATQAWQHLAMRCTWPCAALCCCVARCSVRVDMSDQRTQGQACTYVPVVWHATWQRNPLTGCAVRRRAGSWNSPIARCEMLPREHLAAHGGAGEQYRALGRRAVSSRWGPTCKAPDGATVVLRLCDAQLARTLCDLPALRARGAPAVARPACIESLRTTHTQALRTVSFRCMQRACSRVRIVRGCARRRDCE